MHVLPKWPTISDALEMTLLERFNERSGISFVMVCARSGFLAETKKANLRWPLK